MSFIYQLILNFYLFCIGLFGVILNSNNLILILMSIEIIFLSINLNFLFFSKMLDDILGGIFTIIVLTVAASELAIGLALIILWFKLKGTISISKMNQLSF